MQFRAGISAASEPNPRIASESAGADRDTASEGAGPPLLGGAFHDIPHLETSRNMFRSLPIPGLRDVGRTSNSARILQNYGKWYAAFYVQDGYHLRKFGSSGDGFVGPIRDRIDNSVRGSKLGYEVRIASSWQEGTSQSCEIERRWDRHEAISIGSRIESSAGDCHRHRHCGRWVAASFYRGNREIFLVREERHLDQNYLASNEA